MGRTLTFTDVRFVKSATTSANYPVIRDAGGNLLPVIAVAGRSNVGKSSLLNQLFRRKGLVKTSATPGKTQLLNFFTVDDTLAFVDLPGYGFAQVPVETRKQWGPMVHGYLEQRETVKLILFLFDIRRLPNQDDLQLLNWIVHTNKAVILVLTKVDKVNRGARQSQTQKILKGLGFERLHYVHFSVTENIGRRELIAMIIDALADEATEQGHG
jgi:GTP-binding protein